MTGGVGAAHLGEGDVEGRPVRLWGRVMYAQHCWGRGAEGRGALWGMWRGGGPVWRRVGGCAEDVWEMGQGDAEGGGGQLLYKCFGVMQSEYECRNV